MNTVIVIDPDGKEHTVPKDDAAHFASKEGWVVKGDQKADKSQKKK